VRRSSRGARGPVPRLRSCGSNENQMARSGVARAASLPDVGAQRLWTEKWALQFARLVLSEAAPERVKASITLPNFVRAGLSRSNHINC
jgi:hypothetical protein